MATDRYSDNHKIVVGGIAGTKEFELQANTIKHSANSDLYITTENSYFVSNSYAEFISNGVKFSYTDASGINFYQDLIVDSDVNIIMGSGSDIKMSDTSKLYGAEFDIWAGVDTSSGTLSISANEGHSPKIVLSQSGNSITETAGLWQVSADTIVITGDTVAITNSTPRANTTIMPGSSFLILESYSGSGDSSNNAQLGVGDEFQHTVNGNIIWSMDTIGSGYLYGHVFASLPDSIPDGSVITHLGFSLDRDGDTNFLTTSCYIRSYEFSNGNDVEIYAQSISSSTGHITLFSDDLFNATTSAYETMTLDKSNFAYSIKVRFKLEQGGSRCNIYLTSVKIGYTTTKLDPNI
jgi:hypothetical protein